MNFSIKAAALTDIGAKNRVNQDAIMLKTAVSRDLGRICFAVCCDGLGGLSRGEVASSAFINRMEKWFFNDFVTMSCDPVYGPGDSHRLLCRVRIMWSDIARQMNEAIAEYGRQEGIKLGTTAVLFLLVGHRYLIMHVGDSRLYMSQGGNFRQMTRDHSLIQKQLDSGVITPMQALVSDKKSVLLQCIGASETIEPEFQEGALFQDASVILCSDGCWRKIGLAEISESMSDLAKRDERLINDRARELIAGARRLGEQDNISVILISLTADRAGSGAIRGVIPADFPGTPGPAASYGANEHGMGIAAARGKVAIC